MDYSHSSWVLDRLNIIPIMCDHQENYRHNGFLMAFAFNIPMANVSVLQGYGENNIADMTSEHASFAANKSETIPTSLCL